MFKKQSLDEIINSQDKDTVKEALTLVQHAEMVDFVSILNAALHVFRAQSDEKSISAEVLKELISQARSFFLKQKDLSNYFEVIENKKDIDSLKWITNEMLMCALVLYQRKNDTEISIACSEWMKKTSNVPVDFYLTKNIYKGFESYYSHEDLLQLVRKDLLFHNQSRESFVESLENYYYLQSKKSYFDSLFALSFSNMWLWLKSYFYKDTINPFILRDQYYKTYNKAEELLIKQFLSLALKKPEFFSALKSDPKAGKLLRTISNIEDKSLKIWRLEFKDLDSFERIVKIHKEFSNRYDTPQKFSKTVSKHISFKRGHDRDIYLEYYRRAQDNAIDDNFVRGLSLVFSQDDGYHRTIFNQLCENKPSVNYIINLRDFYLWMSKENKFLHPELFERIFSHALKNHSHDDVLGCLFESPIRKNLQFSFGRSKFLNAFKDLSPEVIVEILTSNSKLIDHDLAMSLKLKLFHQGRLSYKDFKSICDFAIVTKDKAFVLEAFEYYNILEKVENKHFYTSTCCHLLRSLKWEDLNAEQKLLYQIPINELDFNPDRIQSFLTWYKAVPEQSQKKCHEIVQRNIVKIFAYPMRVSPETAGYIKEMLTFMGHKEHAKTISSWQYTNKLIVEINEIDHEEEFLAYMSKVDFNKVKNLSQYMRDLIADEIEFKTEDDAHNLYDTLKIWFKDINNPSLQKLLISPKQYIIDLLHKADSEVVELNPIAADYVKKCLDQSEKIEVSTELEKKSSVPGKVLSFVSTVVDKPIESINMTKTEQADTSVHVLTRSEHKFMKQLLQLESYLLQRTHTHLKHSALIYDLFEQAKVVVKCDYYDELAINALEEQIKNHPGLKMKYKKTNKLAQNIFYSAWVGYIRKQLEDGNASKFHRSFESLAREIDTVQSKTARKQLATLIKGYKNLQKLGPGNKRVV